MAVVVVVAVGVLVPAVPVAAHTGFDHSVPGDGDEVPEPVDEVVLVFTGEAGPAGEGFVALDPERGVRSPDEVTSTEPGRWLLRFDPPLAGGEVAVRWTVKAADAHAISGGFAFVVTAPTDGPGPEPAGDAGSVDGAGSVESAASASDAAKGAGSAGGAGSTDGTEPTGAAGTTGGVGVEQAPPGGTGGLGGGTEDSAWADSRALRSQPVPVADFVEAGSDRLEDAEFVGRVGRALGYSGTILAIGALLVAALVLDRRRDIETVVRWAGLCGLVVVSGTGLEMVGQTLLRHGQWSSADLLSVAAGDAGYSFLLRAAGGGLLWALPSPRLATVAPVRADPARAFVDSPAAGSFPAPAVVELGAGSAGSGGGGVRAVVEPVVNGPTEAGGAIEADVDPGAVVWRRGGAAAIAAVASLMLATSHIFDGHTLSQGNRVVMSLASMAHVIAAAAWAGGVVALALILVVNRRRRMPLPVVELGTRFSVVAAAGLVVAGLAGGALTVMIVDSAEQLWSTEWGRLLLVKVALVIAAAAVGGFNHVVLIPQLQRRSGQPSASSTTDAAFGRLVAIEALLLTLVAVLTGILVGAAL